VSKPKERPILFSAPMVRAILDGRKTQSRRVVKPQPCVGPLPGGKYEASDPFVGTDGVWRFMRGAVSRDADDVGRCKYGEVGDRLWVRETFSLNHSIHYAHDNGRGVTGMMYRASTVGDVDPGHGRPFEGERRWRPSIHMPRWASRITLEVTGVRVERVQEITAGDCYAEGVRTVPSDQKAAFMPGTDIGAMLGKPDDRYRSVFMQYWEMLNAKRGYGWDANPWVWVIEFKRADGE
jgi:hypothetical protein